MKPFNRLFVFIYYFVGFISWILHPTSVEGMEKLPRSGVLLCPNHSSNWDPILVALRLPINYRLHIMAKEELFQNPLLGWLLKKVGAFPVSRGRNDLSSVKMSMQAIKSGDTLYLSGQIGMDPATGELVSADVKEQAAQALANMKAILAEAGATPANVSKVTVFIVDMADFQAVNAVYAETFGSEPPARSCVAVAALPKGARVEIEATAVL